jgi:hypothetical protein
VVAFVASSKSIVLEKHISLAPKAELQGILFQLERLNF